MTVLFAVLDEIFGVSYWRRRLTLVMWTLVFALALMASAMVLAIPILLLSP